MSKDLIGKKAVPVVNEPQEIGIDIDDDLLDAILEGVSSDIVDVSSLDSFSNITQSRENIYQLIDSMAADDRVSAVLETFTEDTVETNDKGQVVWCESSDEDVANYVGYLLDVLNVDKNIYEWVYSLLRYGDVYLRLYRQSDYDKDEDFLFNINKKDEKEDKRLNESFDDLDDEQETLNENVNVSIHDVNDHYVQYVEMVSNPGEMFELTKYGKTRAYISAPCNIQEVVDYTSQLSNYLTYKLKQKDVTVYGATDFVHASLRNSNNIRNPEEVRIFKDDKDYESNSNAGVYKVKRGQSLLYNKFKIWRQVSLTENSILLDRVTKSSLIRLISIETAGMPKNKVPEYLARMKAKIEQKVAMSVDNGSMSNYTNPGPVVNTIITPTKDGQGTINIQTIGEGYDPKSLTDLDTWQTRFYGSFRVPKAYFNLTDDGAGFNGGTSLTILSSRYGKAIKQYQNIVCQLITDLINLFLIDAGYDNYINKFTIRMQAPVTQEELDRRDNLRNRVGVINDVMNQAGNVDLDELTKLKVYKELLATSITDPAVISLIQERIDALEKEKEKEKENSEADDKKKNRDERKESSPRESTSLNDFGRELGFEERPTPKESSSEEETSYLPNPNELNIDLTGNQ